MQTLNLLHCGYTARCDAVVDKHFDYHTLQLMTCGEIEVWYGAKKYSLSGGWLWPAYPGPHIRFHLSPKCRSWEHRYLAFNGPQVGVWKASRLWLDAPQALPNERIIDLFDQLLIQARRSDIWGMRRATNLLEQILLELAEARLQPPAQEPWLEEILQAVHAAQAFAPDYEQLARACNMGQSTLRRRFKEATGTSLHSYVMQRRIARAKDLLGETDWPLKQIAAQLCFSDVYFFSSQFKKIAGISPAAYRRTRQR